MSLIHSRFFLFSLSLALIASPSIVAGYVCLIEFLIEICLAAITSKLFAHYYFGWWRKKDNSGRIKTIPFAQRTDRCIWFSCLAIAFTQTRESCAHVWKSSFSVWDWTGENYRLFFSRFSFGIVTPNGCYCLVREREKPRNDDDWAFSDVAIINGWLYTNRRTIVVPVPFPSTVATCFTLTPRRRWAKNRE